jgi:hypothetical protein
MPTLAHRRPLAERIRAKLRGQIERDGLEGEVELLSLEDDGTLPVGRKRNLLVAQARGAFLVHVDDDDDVSPDYLGLVLGALRAEPEVTHLGIRGEISFRGAHARPFVMSNRYRAYRTRDGCYTRPPHHLNPVRAEIARRYPFEEVRSGEDSDWALRMARDGVLGRERMIEPILYYYRSRRRWAYQAALDRTEWIRHPLGVQLVNRHRVRRWLRGRLRGGRA